MPASPPNAHRSTKCNQLQNCENEPRCQPGKPTLPALFFAFSSRHRGPIPPRRKVQNESTCQNGSRQVPLSSCPACPSWFNPPAQLEPTPAALIQPLRSP